MAIIAWIAITACPIAAVYAQRRISRREVLNEAEGLLRDE